MNETVTATFASADAVKTVVDDLLGVGIPQEKFFVDKGSHQIKVIAAGDTAAEILELLKSHKPTKIDERKWT